MSMDDNISRQAIIDRLNYVIEHGVASKTTGLHHINVETVKAYVEGLPPAEQRTAKTVIYYGDGYADGKAVYDEAECPKCGYHYEAGDKDFGEPYCPHCGQPLKWGTTNE